MFIKIKGDSCFPGLLKDTVHRALISADKWAYVLDSEKILRAFNPIHYDFHKPPTLEASINLLKPKKVIMMFESEADNKIYCQSCQSQKVTFSLLSSTDQFKFLMECHSCGELWKE